VRSQSVPPSLSSDDLRADDPRFRSRPVSARCETAVLETGLVRRRRGLFICTFNRFQIKGPPLYRALGYADWQEIALALARRPPRQPKNRYELRRRDKIIFRSPSPSPQSGSLVLLRGDSFFLRWTEKSRGPTRDRVVIPQIAFSVVALVSARE